MWFSVVDSSTVCDFLYLLCFTQCTTFYNEGIGKWFTHQLRINYSCNTNNTTLPTDLNGFSCAIIRLASVFATPGVILGCTDRGCGNLEDDRRISRNSAVNIPSYSDIAWDQILLFRIYNKEEMWDHKVINIQRHSYEIYYKYCRVIDYLVFTCVVLYQCLLRPLIQSEKHWCFTTHWHCK